MRPPIAGGVWVVALAACGTGGAQTGRGAAQSMDEAWRRGPRDSSLAAAMACAVSREFGGGARCEVVGFRESAADYVVRIRETSGFPASVVRLAKDGTGASVERLPEP